jgi:hypothetical protein
VSPIETIQSRALTRDSRSPGTYRWIIVTQITLPTVKARPETNPMAMATQAVVARAYPTRQKTDTPQPT